MVDGDKGLVIADEIIIVLAERNMKDIVPLYYNMKKAAPALITNENIYNGLISAFVGGNIGIYSNDITKIWNSDIFINGTDEEKQNATDVVKLLCAENNFCIDYAKTLYKPTRPEEANKKITALTKKKLPAFFEYAKDKNPEQVAEINGSFVNRLRDLIPNPRLNFKKIGLKEIDYKILMSEGQDEKVVVNKKVVQLYEQMNKQYHFQINMKDSTLGNYRYIAVNMLKEFRKVLLPKDLNLEMMTNDEIELLNKTIDIQICDILVKYLYGKKKSKNKESLWFCYGEIIYENIYRNLKPIETKCIQCEECGEWLEVKIQSKSKLCPECKKKRSKEKNKDRKKDTKIT